MKLKFVEITKKNGKETKKVIFTWSDVPTSKVACVCQNFMSGFLYAMGLCGKYLRYPDVMIMDGWSAQTLRWHDSDGGKMWRFENGRGEYITHWCDRTKKKTK